MIAPIQRLQDDPHIQFFGRAQARLRELADRVEALGQDVRRDAEAVGLPVPPFVRRPEPNLPGIPLARPALERFPDNRRDVPHNIARGYFAEVNMRVRFWIERQEQENQERILRNPPRFLQRILRIQAVIAKIFRVDLEHPTVYGLSLPPFNMPAVPLPRLLDFQPELNVQVREEIRVLAQQGFQQLVRANRETQAGLRIFFEMPIEQAVVYLARRKAEDTLPGFRELLRLPPQPPMLPLGTPRLPQANPEMLQERMRDETVAHLPLFQRWIIWIWNQIDRIERVWQSFRSLLSNIHSKIAS